MSCNSCAKPFSLLRKEKGCTKCGFSFCSKCLENKIFIPHLNAEAKVCMKCKNASLKKNDPQKFEPPDAYYKRIGAIKSNSVETSDGPSGGNSSVEQEILNRLTKLKEGRTTLPSNEEMAKRLQKLKGDVPKTTDEELQERLAKLRGVPVTTLQTQPVFPAQDLRTEQEQADDLIKQFQEQTKIDTKYKDEFDSLVNDMEARVGKLRGAEGGPSGQIETTKDEIESEDEEEIVKKIVQKIKSDTDTYLDGDDIPATKNDELPFCEICNEDAKMRCLGCRYLFCKRCFMEHMDDDDGCNKYEPYTAPKGSNI